MAIDQIQAGILYKNAAHFIAASPELSKEFEASDYYKKIKCHKTDGEIITCSAEVAQKEGHDLHAVILDELHLFTGKKREAWNVYSGAGAARQQSLRIAISTAGRDRNSVMYELVQLAHKIDSGEVINLNYLGVVYGPKPGEKFDPHDRETWIKCNPSLGHTLNLRRFTADYEEAKISPSAFADWKQRRLNCWLDEGDGRLISSSDWSNCPPRRTLEQVIASGDPIFAGMDLSSTVDLTAFALVAGSLERGLDLFVWAWITEEEAKQRESVNGIPYGRWAECGFVEIMKSKRIDYDEVFAKVAEVFKATRFRMLYTDYYSAGQTNHFLAKAGIPFKHIYPGFKSQNAPTKEVERLVAEGLLRHSEEGSPNELMSWVVSNATAVRDKHGNVMIQKNLATHKVDPLAATIAATAGLVDEYVAEAEVQTITPEMARLIY